jgi:hypothetical protein
MKENLEVTESGNIDGSSPEEIAAKIKNHPDNQWTVRNKLIRQATINSGLSLFVSLVSIVLAYYAFTTTTSTQRELKAIDLRQSFQKRYEELVFDGKDKASAPVQDQGQAQKLAIGYYHRFWDLQLEEYQYWKDGLVDAEVYASWMDFRRLEWKANDPLQGVTYQQAWAEVKVYFLNHETNRIAYYKEFTDFMEGVFQGKTETYAKGPKK